MDITGSKFSEKEYLCHYEGKHWGRFFWLSVEGMWYLEQHKFHSVSTSLYARWLMWNNTPLPGAWENVLCACFFGFLLFCCLLGLWACPSRRYEQHQSWCNEIFLTGPIRAAAQCAHADIYYWVEDVHYSCQWVSIHSADNLLWICSSDIQLIDVDTQVSMNIELWATAVR